jgi:hypothetical protein
VSLAGETGSGYPSLVVATLGELRESAICMAIWVVACFRKTIVTLAVLLGPKLGLG